MEDRLWLYLLDLDLDLLNLKSLMYSEKILTNDRIALLFYLSRSRNFSINLIK